MVKPPLLEKSMSNDITVLIVGAFVVLALAFFGLLITFLFRIRIIRREQDTLSASLAEAQESLRVAEAKIQIYADRFRPVTTLDAEVERLNSEISALLSKLVVAKKFSDQKTEGIRLDYEAKRAVYDALIKEVAIFDERLAFAEMGVYEPHYEFGDSERYKTAIDANRADQKALVSVKSAVLCLREWSVDGSRAEGKKMSDRNIKLTLRSFNNECDAAIANCRWNNVNAMEKRIEKAQEQIDKLNEPNAIVITKEILALKLKELYLTHEYREKLKQEREERAEAARTVREEQKLQRDMERAEEDRGANQAVRARSRRGA
jgi:Domain of unknown function (DUF4041)